PHLLNAAYWWAQGIVPIISDRLYALTQNLASFLAVGAEVFQIGLILMGAFVLRDKLIDRIIWLPWLAFLCLMSFIFPFAGYRGGFFHAQAAFQPSFWVLSAIGLDRFVDWGVRVRRWNKNQAWRIFFYAGIFFAMIFSGFITYQRVIGKTIHHPRWNAAEERYQQLCNKVNLEPDGKINVVMVNNPVGFYLACGEDAIAIPVGSIGTVVEVARKYHANWLILEENHPQQMKEYFLQPRSFDGFELVENAQNYQIYRFNP
ncbi:MAG: hypothetical protein ACPL0B_01915, partial [Anaerolineales bacterium]